MSEWKTVSIKQELIKEIEKIIRMGRYRSISEFVSEATRLRLEELTRADATSSGKPQETSPFRDETAKEAPKLKDKEHVQLLERLEQTTSQDALSQTQTYQTQAPVQQKETNQFKIDSLNRSDNLPDSKALKDYKGKTTRGNTDGSRASCCGYTSGKGDCNGGCKVNVAI